MSAPGLAQRLGVFACFVAFAAAGVYLHRPAPSAKAPTGEELAALEAAMAAAGRLHPAAPKSRPSGSASFCAGCHPAPPHPGRQVAAAMLNEHSGRMDCLLCHWPAAGGARPAPAWQVPAGSPVFLAVLPVERATKAGLESLRAAATVARRCFEPGPGCGDCHRPGGMGAMVRPGSPPGRARALETLENYLTLSPGEKWYFPQLQ